MKKMIQPGVIFRSFGISITIIGLFMLTAIPVAIIYSENTITPFLISSVLLIGIGQSLVFFTRKHSKKDIGERDAYLIVSLTWVMAGFFGSLPYLLSSTIPDFTNAYFETISGFTTTGASILSEIESLPKSILYWRSLTHWLGGMGILVLVIAVLPVIGFGGVKLFVAEAPGPTSNKIHPRIRQTALRLWIVYFFMTFLLVLLLIAGKMNIFEAVCHAMGTLSTGGFSPKNSSIADYSPYIQVVITIFMFFGGINFALHYYLLRGKFRKIFANEEWLSFTGFIIFISAIVSVSLYQSNIFNSFSECLRHSFFQCVSIITATGYATADYTIWPQMNWILLFLLLFTGGMIGSTSGGIKFTRHLVLFKNLRYAVRKELHPHLLATIRINKKPIPEDVIRNFMIIFITYLFTFCVGSLLMSFYTDKTFEAFGVVASCLGGVGPAFGKFGPAGNYNDLKEPAKWILSLIMVIGRIELIPVIIIFTKSFWKP
jgi:trk system potassium uptake protein